MIKLTPQNEQTIKQVCKLANPRAQIAALANVLIDASPKKTTITAGDGTVEMNATLDCEVKTGGRFTVDADKLVKALSACGFDAAITIKDGHVMVTSGRRKFKLTTLDADTYPAYQEIGEQTPINATLADIKAVAVSCAQGDARVFLNGVYVGTGLAGSDGHRITFLDGHASDDDIIIPAEAIKKAPDGEPKVSTDTRTVSLEYPHGTFKARLVDSKYPDFKRAITTTDKTLTVNAESLSDAVRSAMITAEQVRIDFASGVGRVQGFSKNQDETDIGFDAQGDAISMAFNARYIIDALAFYTGEVEIGFNDNQMVIDGDFVNVVMCVRV